ncbi:MAG: class I SAM-dependent methyltransferase [Candidatus Caldarchaeum sp.]|nr:class I SAM-dependent methyltransferase [Candidatus Caldarchaeum sp.]
MTVNLTEYWEYVARHSFHLRQQQPALTDFYYRKILISLLQSLSSKTGRRILKLDAYNEATHTQYGFYMLNRFDDLFLADISETIIRKALDRACQKGLLNRVDAVVADFRSLPFRSKTFDMSCSFGSIEHVAEYSQAFYEQTRVVKHGGDVVVGVPNVANFSMRWLSAKILHMLGLMKKATNPEKHFHRRQLAALAKAVGLTDVKVSGYHLFPKQLRWLDLWLTFRGVKTFHRNRLFRWLLKAFTLLELRYDFAKKYAEMLLVKGVRKTERGKALESLRYEAVETLR